MSGSFGDDAALVLRLRGGAQVRDGDAVDDVVPGVLHRSRWDPRSDHCREGGPFFRICPGLHPLSWTRRVPR